MSQIKTLNGVQYTLPQYNDTAWGANTGNVLTQYLAAIADVTLQLSGGTFTLTSNVDFGPNFGLKALFYQTKAANPALSGTVRFATGDSVAFRNNANTGDIYVGKDTSDNLNWNNTKILLSGNVVNADINAAAAIAYSKLALTGAILNGDLAGSIAASKLVAMATSKVVVTDGSGFVTTAAPTVTEINYVSGVTSSIQTQLNSAITNPMTTNLTVGAHKITLQPGTNLASLDGTGTIFQIGANYDLGAIADATKSACNINLNTPAGASSIVIAVASAINTGTSAVATFNPAANGGTQLVGDSSGANAASGIVGEYISATVSSASVPATGTWGDIAGGSIALTAGDWDISLFGQISKNGGTLTDIQFGVNTVSGNNAPTTGLNTAEWYQGGTAIQNVVPISLGRWRLNTSGSVTVYTKFNCGYTVATPLVWTTISARRMR